MGKVFDYYDKLLDKKTKTNKETKLEHFKKYFNNL